MNADEKVIQPDADESAKDQTGEESAGKPAQGVSEPVKPEDGEQADEKSSSDQEKKPGEDEPKKENADHKKNRYQERINRITTQKYEAIARAEVAERQRDILQDRLDKMLSVPAPRPADFETEESFEEARLAHMSYKAAARIAAETAKESARAAAHEADLKRIEAFRERVKEVAEVIPDFTEKVSKSQAPISRYMGDAIHESPHAAHIMYHFADNPDEAREIFAMSPVEQIKEIGKLEGRIQNRLRQAQSATTTKGQEVKSAPKAQPVIRPANTTSSGSGTGKFDPYDTNLSDDERLRRYKKSRGLD